MVFAASTFFTLNLRELADLTRIIEQCVYHEK